MIEIPRPEEKNIAKDVRKLFLLEKLKNETIDTTIKDIKNLFRIKKKKKQLKTKYSEIFETLLD